MRVGWGEGGGGEGGGGNGEKSTFTSANSQCCCHQYQLSQNILTQYLDEEEKPYFSAMQSFPSPPQGSPVHVFPEFRTSHLVLAISLPS